jgi:uncharacterized membrane protein YccF (DUF307 family)
LNLLQFLLNVIWIAVGGIWMSVAWVIAGLIMAITIVGLPWTPAAFRIAAYTLLPFGSRAVPRAQITGHDDFGTGPLGLLGNILWLVLAGWWLALGHLITDAKKRSVFWEYPACGDGVAHRKSTALPCARGGPCP